MRKKTIVSILPPDNTGDTADHIHIRIPDGNKSHVLTIFTSYDPKDEDDVEACIHVDTNEGRQTYAGSVLEVIQKLAELTKTEL